MGAGLSEERSGRAELECWLPEMQRQCYAAAAARPLTEMYNRLYL